MNCAEKIIRANNLLQFIHQVTIEIRFRKTLAQERSSSVTSRKTGPSNVQALLNPGYEQKRNGPG